MMRSGQITVLVLLLGLLGLTTALSAASRSLSDLKQVTQVDVGTKAFAAAEAGLEFALNDFSKNNTIKCGTPQPVDFVIPNVSGITYTICANNLDYAIQTNVAKDEVMQVDLTGVPMSVKYFDFLWNSTNAAVEITLVRSDNSVERYYVNGTSVSSANGFDTQVLPVSSCVDTQCGDAVNFSGGNCKNGASGTIIDHKANDKLIRVKPLYQSGINLAVCARNNSNGRNGLSPQQTVVITVTATTTNGTVKKLQATKTQPTLPAVFDSVLFSSGNIQK